MIYFKVFDIKKMDGWEKNTYGMGTPIWKKSHWIWVSKSHSDKGTRLAMPRTVTWTRYCFTWLKLWEICVFRKKRYGHRVLGIKTLVYSFPEARSISQEFCLILGPVQKRIILTRTTAYICWICCIRAVLSSQSTLWFWLCGQLAVPRSVLILNN